MELPKKGCCYYDCFSSACRRSTSQVSWLQLVCCCRYGFIVMDGNGSLFGTLSGNTREVLHKFTVELPKKHGRGGQSALRFARLRLEKRHNYVRKVRFTPLWACRDQSCVLLSPGQLPVARSRGLACSH